VLKGTAKVSEEVAAYLAQKWQAKLTWALQKNGTIGPYSVMRQFTAGHGSAYQAHHILEKKMMKELELGNPDLVPSVILTQAEHKVLTAELAKETAGVDTLEGLWKAYQKVYIKNPEWLEAIKSYFAKGK
jgi:hypothetical protein